MTTTEHVTKTDKHDHIYSESEGLRRSWDKANIFPPFTQINLILASNLDYQIPSYCGPRKTLIRLPRWLFHYTWPGWLAESLTR